MSGNPTTKIQLEALAMDVKAALLSLRQDVVANLIRHGLDSGLSSSQLMDGCISPVLHDFGKRWDAGEVALSQVYMASRILDDVLLKAFAVPVSNPQYSAKIGVALLEDFHLLGKRMVVSALRSAGVPLIDLGRVTVGDVV